MYDHFLLFFENIVKKSSIFFAMFPKPRECTRFFYVCYCFEKNQDDFGN